MELVNFSVTNFRSITTAHKVAISDTTILIGKNNEGKSNLLKALDVGMTALKRHAFEERHGLRSIRRTLSRTDENFYFWERDFPINFQTRSSGMQTIIRLDFFLNEEEILEFKKEIKSNLNGTLPIVVKIGKDNTPIIGVSKSGKGSHSLNSKSGKIAEFIAEKIIFNYIPAVRTDQEALEVVSKMLSMRLKILEDEPKYVEALKTIEELQQPILKSLSKRIKEPLEEFLPGIKDVTIEIVDRKRRYSVRRDFDIIIDDGTPTNLSFKGDGVKSLAALGLLKDRIRKGGASIIAIEEPESHLHPAAIHQLNDVIKSLSKENQVILTTHNPLFVDRIEVNSNIIVDQGKASPAKNIKIIRNLLGIKSSDNLTNASYVLVVEGENDAISLKALLAHLSEKLKKNLNNHLLIVDPIGGAGNLPYKLTLLKNQLCTYHCFLDNDSAGKNSFRLAENDGLLSLKNCTFATCKGSSNSEFEDCLNANLYSPEIEKIYGVDLNCSEFKSNAVWGDRIKDAFLDQGKPWNKGVEAKLKNTIANCVVKNPGKALNSHKRNSIDALVKSLEQLIKD